MAIRKPDQRGLKLESLYEVITGVHKRLRRGHIEEGTYSEMIARYDGQETFFYLDPPYFDTAGYRYNITIEDHERLAGILAGIQGKFLLSINDHPAMREVYGKFDIGEVEVQYSISRDKDACGVFGELMVINCKGGLKLFFKYICCFY